MMTLSEVFNEMETCEARIKELQREVMAETDKNIAMAKLDEMVALAKRVAELDTLHKSLLTAKLAVEKAKMIKTLREIKQKAH